MDKITELLWLSIGLFIGVLLTLSAVLSNTTDEPEYKTNLAKYEVELNRCLDYPKGNIIDCHEVAIFKSKTCVEGCE